MNEAEIIQLIKDFFQKYGKTPTASSFSKEYNICITTIIREISSWNDLINKAGFKPNRSTKRTDEQLLLWIKSHPNAKYAEIPVGIRSSLEIRFGSISNARQKAGLSIIDWRSFSKKKKKTSNGRPLEFSKEIIIDGLLKLASKLNRPPRLKDIKKTNCGFNMNVVLSRFDSLNDALQEAGLPPSYSYHSFNKLVNEFQILMMNIKICLNDIPKYYNIKSVNKATFVYDDKLDFVKLTRSEISETIDELLKNKKEINVFYLVDDSLYENDKINMVYVFDIINKLNDTILIDKIRELRLKYDEINIKYVGQPLYLKAVR